jgi:hypothetical protein
LNGTTGADNNWEQRTVLGSGGNIFESGGEAAENAPELRTTISGLVPGANCAAYVFFWDANGTTENWSIRAGFSSAAGANPLYSAADASGTLGATASALASSLNYVTAPTLFVEANRVLLAASLGVTTANPSGQIHVYLDDKPSTIGANNRTWMDGVGWALSPATSPVSINYIVNGSALTLSWPATHTGWRLESCTNTHPSAPAASWFTVPGTLLTNQISLSMPLTRQSEYFRLALP